MQIKRTNGSCVGERQRKDREDTGSPSGLGSDWMEWNRIEVTWKGKRTSPVREMLTISMKKVTDIGNNKVWSKIMEVSFCF